MKRPSRWLVVLYAAFIALAIACNGKTLPPQGEVVVVIATDVALPDAIDKIRLEIQVRGVTKLANDYEVGAGRLLVPATLGVLQGDDPSAPVSFRLIGRKGGAAKLVRDVITTIPNERIVSLRMPIRWLCDDTAQDKLPITNPPTVEPKRCPLGQTCIGGDCYGPEIDPNTLPEYTDVDRGDGVCFDVPACLGGATVADLDLATCTIAKPPDAATLNVALRVDKDGVCDPITGVCWVALDHQLTAGPLDGWRIKGDRIELAQEVCRRSSTSPPRVLSVVTSTTCPAKPPNLPLCGPWRPADGGGTRPGDAGGPLGVLAQSTSTESTGFQIANSAALYGNSLLFATVGSPGPNIKFAFLDVESKALKSVTPPDTIGVPGFFVGSPTPYFASYKANSPMSPWDVMSVDLAAQSISVVRQISAANVGLVGLAADATRLYWLDGVNVLDASATLRSGLPTTASSDVALTTFTRPSYVARGVVADANPDGFVLLATGRTGGTGAVIERIAKSARNGELTPLATLPTTDCNFPVIDGADVFVIGMANLSDKGMLPILHIAADGAVATRYTAPAATLLQVDASNLYWVEERTRLIRAPKAGGGAPVTLATAAAGATLNDIVVGPDRVYYWEGTAGSWKVIAVAK